MDKPSVKGWLLLQESSAVAGLGVPIKKPWSLRWGPWLAPIWIEVRLICSLGHPVKQRGQAEDLQFWLGTIQ